MKRLLSTFALCVVMAAGCAESCDESSDPDVKDGFRVRVPDIPPIIQARLKETLGTYRNKPIYYRHSDDAGLSTKDAIIIDAFNMITGGDAEKHILAQKYRGSTLQLHRAFKEQGHYYHVWKVFSDDGNPIEIFIDATYFHLVI